MTLFLPASTLFLFEVSLPLLILVGPILDASTRFALVFPVYVSCHLLAKVAATLAGISGAPLAFGQLLLLSPALAVHAFLVAFEPCLACFVPSVRFPRH